MRKRMRNAIISLSAAMILCLLCAVGASAQVKTDTASANGQPKVETQVERGEVVSVSGNDLFVKMEDGSLRHFANVPESAKVTVEGKELGIHDLKPGMKLERTITTTTTPTTVTTTQTVTGTVLQIMAPNAVTLRLEDGSVQKFNIPKGQKFTVDGQETDAFGLRKGMNISATKVVEEPQTVVDQKRQVTGTMPPPPEPPAANQPILVASTAAPAPPPVTAKAEAPEKLPNSATPMPLLGLVGLLSLVSGTGLWIRRPGRRA